ncbi:uncharacterized protein LOC123554085 [Mercenaria mercenaria]|uniref:uncharacterized protein LOC123554085 n=1 Tax=Mercenaria mercenaria TaxID=6596 RepID=UPI00234EEB3F|nr:uncharacterized protein LOC123554085 [Mercenaria mercenaria]
MLSSYRTNLLALYKGDNTHIPSRSTLENSSLLTGSIKYAGYQVAYIAWGFILQLIVLFLSALVISIIIALIRLGIYQWILTLLSSIWPAVLMTIMVMLAQTILTKYAFLQENGEVLAIDNR